MGPDHADSVRAAIHAERRRLDALERQRAESHDRLLDLEAQLSRADGQVEPTPLPLLIAPDTPAAKVTLFRSLFRGRDDVFPKLWTNARTQRSGYAPACRNEWVKGICEKPRVRCGECPHQAFIAPDDRAVMDHLQGRAVIGVYPLLRDETCWLLAADFDGDAWHEDAGAFVEAGRNAGVPVALERSRSGNGAHAWIFFAAPIRAALARQLGCLLITEAMAHRHEIGMQSYDRLFPSQDTMPKGGFGNLIALPLQHGARELGNTTFLDDALVPFPDQWAYLAGIERVTHATVLGLVEDAARENRILGVRLSEDLDEASPSPWQRSSPTITSSLPLPGPMPAEVRIVESQQLFVETAGLPAPLLTALARLAAFQNPEFYKRQSLRLSTALTPRVISCAEGLPQHLALPRGCLPDLRALLDTNDIALILDDRRERGGVLDVSFQGKLSDVQRGAADVMLAHDTGVFVAPPGSGKTVVGAYLVAARSRTTLILTHRRPLVDQWRAQLSVFLGLEPDAIGHIGSGHAHATGRLDVAMLQSLVKRDDLADMVAAYGHVVVDECHHVPAVSFERVLKRVSAQYLTGLTATPTRRDGHHPILTMRLGPVRFTVKAGASSERSSARRRLIVRNTSFAGPADSASVVIQKLYGDLASDEDRNAMILDDVIAAVAEGRAPVVLTERREHVELLAARLRPFVKNLVVLKGGTTEKQRRLALQTLHEVPQDQERTIVATGRYLGEGFDDARLDTLFLALPISWKGTLAQYVGRLHRVHADKTEVRVYDYVDGRVAMLKRMFERRLKGYRALGYSET